MIQFISPIEKRNPTCDKQLISGSNSELNKITNKTYEITNQQTNNTVTTNLKLTNRRVDNLT